MANERDAQCRGDADLRVDAEELGLTVEVGVLTGLDDVEAGDPEEDRETKRAGDFEMIQTENRNPCR